MDELTSIYKVPRSRVVELFWNGFAKPNIDNLLFPTKPQPKKQIEANKYIRYRS